MSMTFTKLFSSITESTVWCEPDRVRIVWIAMLAMADSKGRVWASVPGLANRARVPLEDAQDAINRFLAPDPYSRTPDYEGRRIEPIDGGWRLLNHEKYRSIRDSEAAKESKRRYINSRRAREAVENVEHSRTQSSAVERSRDNAEADTEAEAETVKNSEANASGASAPKKLTADEVIFSYGVPLLVNAGTPEKQARSFLGGLRKSHGDDAVVNALRECIRAKPLQPLEWLAGALKPKVAGKQTALESRNAAVAARWLQEQEHAAE